MSTHQKGRAIPSGPPHPGGTVGLTAWLTVVLLRLTALLTLVRCDSPQLPIASWRPLPPWLDDPPSSGRWPPPAGSEGPDRLPVTFLGTLGTKPVASYHMPSSQLPLTPLVASPGLLEPSPAVPKAAKTVMNQTAAAAFCQRVVRGGGASRVPLYRLGMPLHLSPAPNRRLITSSDVFVDASTRDRGLAAARRMLPKSSSALGPRLGGRSCAVVGNSGTLLQGRHGADIDRHGVVFRVNQAPTKGYEAYVGTRTHFRLLNAKWTEDYGNDRQGRLPLERGVVLVASRGTQLVQNFRRMVSRIQRAGRKDVQMTLLQYQAVARTRGLLRAFKKCVEAGGTKYPPGSVPTSGLVLITNIMDVCSSISVYGFGSTGKKGMGRPPYQYFKGLGSRPTGNPTHSFQGEMFLIKSLAHANYVRFCNAGSCVGTGRNKS